MSTPELPQTPGNGIKRAIYAQQRQLSRHDADIVAAPSTPWPPQGPPTGFDYDRDLPTPSVLPSDTAAFDTGWDKRDTFRGTKRCVVCGASAALEHCHIVPQAEEDTWETMRDHAYVPQKSRQKGVHEPRNGILMCKNHRDMFDHHKYFVRFHQERYYVINFGDIEGMRPYHGKAIALDYAHHHAPYPVVFLLHEVRTRGFWPWQEDAVEISSDSYQDWVVRGGYLDDHGRLDHNGNAPPPPPSQLHPPPGGSSAGYGKKQTMPIIHGVRRLSRTSPRTGRQRRTYRSIWR